MRCAPRVLENLKQGARLVNRGGKINNIKTKKHPTKSTKKKLQSSRKKRKEARNNSCLCFGTSFGHSFNIKCKVRSLKIGHMFLICFASESTLEIYFRKKIQLKHEKVFMYEKS